MQGTAVASVSATISSLPFESPGLGECKSKSPTYRPVRCASAAGTARYPPESEGGEICLFGMSDDEEATKMYIAPNCMRAPKSQDTRTFATALRDSCLECCWKGLEYYSKV